ncbi:MAG TPA: glycosyltransferase family 2 protein [Vicinamibacterales bacterium]|nr:glycosyltransferase family 2 protein [Vicinamibacterales bacterium]
MKLSIIVPAYNEARTIAEVITRVLAVDIGALEREVLIVNDGSSDETAMNIERSPWRADPAVRVFDNPINLGKGAAVRLGLRHATGDIVLIQDADLELDPQQHMRLVQPILDGRTRIVYGSRFAGGSTHIPRRSRVANRALTMLTNVLYGSRLTDMETAYKVFRRELLDGMRLRCVGFDFEPEFTANVLRAGYRILEVPIDYDPRRVDDGKKIRWIDGVDAVYALIKCRFAPKVRRLPPTQSGV